MGWLMWASIVNRIWYFHRTACKAYFTYLNLSAQVSWFFILFRDR